MKEKSKTEISIFKINGIPINENNSPNLKKTIQFLEKLPYGEMIRWQELSKEVGLSSSTVRHFPKEILEKHSYIYRWKKVFGNEKTIKDFKAANGEE